MIAVACSQCGLKLQVEVGDTNHPLPCPTCGRPLSYPDTTSAVELAPGQPLDATRAAQNEFGPNGAGVCLEQPGQPSLRDLLAQRSAGGARYVIAGEIARGGMGAVLRAVDCDIHREVAVKYMLDPGDPRKRLRFVEEAQITGQLEHPNIVPIHELGLDAQRRLFFTMKMVKGRSLAHVLDELRRFPHTTEKEYPLSRLLNVLVSVCHALAYAHSRGVIHRDLKPANIMLGDFGEVYVMDWGLAKVLASGGRESPGLAEPGDSRPPLAVRTDRVLDGDMTQEGAILGTALYMSPEQASGQVGDLDARSDVYAVGALLYEVLTSQPPVERAGGFRDIVLRVIAGAIVPPEQRSPDRARAGKIPRELSAVALKALARLPEGRYASVEALRRDIEHYLQGHAVSAKDDSAWETCVKLVRRNRAVSAVAAAAVLLVGVLLLIGYRINSAARDHAEAARAAAEQSAARMEEAVQSKEERTRKAIPAFVASARLLIERQRYDHALEQVNVALAYDAGHPVARLVRAQLLIVKQDFTAAQGDLDLYLKERPRDVEARRLRELCARPKPGEVGNLLRIVHVFEEMQAPSALSEGVLRDHGASTEVVRAKLLELFRKRIDAAWPGQGANLTIQPGGLYSMSLKVEERVKDLVPLEGIPLTTFYMFMGCPPDLAPLRGMPLTRFNISLSSVADLSPLRDMPLTHLGLDRCSGVQDFSVLETLPGIANLQLPHCALRDLRLLQGLSRLTELNIFGCPVRDLAPLGKLPLRSLSLGRSPSLQDFAPLARLKLTTLALGECDIRDLSPLARMPLTNLSLQQCPHAEDLGPLRDLPLIELDIRDCPKLQNLTPLKGTALERIRLTPRLVGQGIEVLRAMPTLQRIGVVAHEMLPPAEFWKKYDAGGFSK